jgi:trimethylamine--corrinoid protein Co-methyltransferase
MTHLKVLTGDEIEAIHQSTLQILADIGIVLDHDEARSILTGAGAIARAHRVCFPPEMVEAAILECPGQVTILGRAGQSVTVGAGELAWHNLGGAANVYEPTTGERRPATLQDVRDSTRLLDALEGIHSITPFFTPQDVPGGIMSLSMYRHTLPHTTKPVQGPGIQTAAEVRYAAEMAAVIGRPQESLILGISPISPLIFPNDVAAAIIEVARRGVPLDPLPCPTAGATAPMSLAGALAQQNAEVLATIVLAQLVHPGLPIIYCGRLAMMEPKTGVSVWGGVELGLASAATVQIAHRYRLPVNVYGLSTNAHTLEIQNGYERALNAAIPALAGADELSGIGEMEAGVTGSLAQMVCDKEIVASVGRLRRGFAVNDDTLAVEAIAAVMDGSRNFLELRHTVRHLRAGEVLYTRLGERRPWEIWDQEGREGMAERAQHEAERILATHHVAPLTQEQERELDAILVRAEHELAA